MADSGHHSELRWRPQKKPRPVVELGELIDFITVPPGQRSLLRPLFFLLFLPMMLILTLVSYSAWVDGSRSLIYTVAAVDIGTVVVFLSGRSLIVSYLRVPGFLAFHEKGISAQFQSRFLVHYAWSNRNHLTFFTRDGSTLSTGYRYLIVDSHLIPVPSNQREWVDKQMTELEIRVPGGDDLLVRRPTPLERRRYLFTPQITTIGVFIAILMLFLPILFRRGLGWVGVAMVILGIGVYYGLREGDDLRTWWTRLRALRKGSAWVIRTPYLRAIPEWSESAVRVPEQLVRNLDPAHVMVVLDDVMDARFRSAFSTEE